MHSGTELHLFLANLGGNGCSLEIKQAISVVRHFGRHSGMIRRAGRGQERCRNSGYSEEGLP